MGADYTGEITNKHENYCYDISLCAQNYVEVHVTNADYAPKFSWISFND